MTAAPSTGDLGVPKNPRGRSPGPGTDRHRLCGRTGAHCDAKLARDWTRLRPGPRTAVSSMPMVALTRCTDPSDHRLQTEAAARTRALLSQALRSLGREPQGLEIRFDLRGGAAGQARFGGKGPWVIRYNPILLRENPQSFIAQTVPHEVAHLLAYLRHGRRIRPHGPEWRAIMLQLGAAPERCHRYDLTRVPRRALRVFPYHCGCGDHELSTIRHHRVLAGQTYLCRRCTNPLQPGPRPRRQGNPAP